jgi:DNA-binding XRE family transcriptional regulator
MLAFAPTLVDSRPTERRGREAEESKVTDDTEGLLESAIGAVRRIVMEIVELPAARRPVAFNVAELNFREVANAARWETERVAKFVDLQMGALRALVKEIDISGGSRPAGRDPEEGEMTITSEQCKEARRLLGWTMSDLAFAVKLSEMDIARFEAGKPNMSFIGALLIHRALERAGVEFVAAPPSVKLRDSE